MGRHAAQVLANEVYLIAHDDASGRQRVSDRVLALGLAAALLAELLIPRAIIVVGQDFIQVNQATADRVRDALGGTLISRMLSQRRAHPVRDWLSVLAHTAITDVRGRLERDGTLHRVKTPILRLTRFVPADMSVAVEPAVRVHTSLAELTKPRGANDPPPSPWLLLTIEDIVLAAIGLAMGLDEPLLWGTGEPARSYLDTQIADLRPDLLVLIGEVTAAITSAVTAG